MIKDEMQRIVYIHDVEYKLSLNKPVCRYNHNPILTCHDVNEIWNAPQLQVVTVHNSGISSYNGNVVMLFRSHLRNGISVIGKAVSKNGIDNWKISKKPAMVPCNSNDVIYSGCDIKSLIENERGGVEDPRITCIDNQYFITYSAYHGEIKDRVRVSLAITNDFEKITRHGPVIDVDMRNVVIFPEKIDDRYYALFRPNDSSGGQTGGSFSEIRIGYSTDIKSNNWIINNEPVIKLPEGPCAFSDKIGPGAPPLKTKYGWLNIFHGVRNTMDGNPYVLGVALHSLTNPAKVKVSRIPILFPSQADCIVSKEDYVHVPNVVFTCGAERRNDGSILIYYGGNDTVMNLAITHEDILVELCKNYSEVFY